MQIPLKSNQIGRLLLFAFGSLAMTLTVSAVAAQTLDIPIEQQQPPATLAEQYPYRPGCAQLIPQLSATNANFTGWGPVIQGEHRSWYGLPTGMPVEQALVSLDSAGLCVLGGEMVPWQAIESTVVTTVASPKDRAVERLKNAPNNPENNSFASFLLLAATAFGALHLYERLENRPWVRRLTGNRAVTVPVAERRSTRELPSMTAIPNSKVQTG